MRSLLWLEGRGRSVMPCRRVICPDSSFECILVSDVGCFIPNVPSVILFIFKYYLVVFKWQRSNGLGFLNYCFLLHDLRLEHSWFKCSYVCWVESSSVVLVIWPGFEITRHVSLVYLCLDTEPLPIAKRTILTNQLKYQQKFLQTLRTNQHTSMYIF